VAAAFSTADIGAAATFKVEGGRSNVYYTAALEEVNRLTLRAEGDTLVAIDPGAAIAAGPTCTSVNLHEARCPLADAHSVWVVLRHKADEVVVVGCPQTCPEFVFPEGPGDDRYIGGAERDLFLAGATPVLGSDIFIGGDGFDWVSYGLRSSRVRASLDGRPNDGARDEGDNVGVDIERLVGGYARNVLIGNSAPNQLIGTPNTGESSRYVGNVLRGGGGNDRLIGSPGPDVLRGGPGRDVISAFAGNDTIYARDGERDRVLAGKGFDRASKDRLDVVFGLEAVIF
jgi:Ca2+-binding RTX toxin-like protein